MPSPQLQHTVTCCRLLQKPLGPGLQEARFGYPWYPLGYKGLVEDVEGTRSLGHQVQTVATVAAIVPAINFASKLLCPSTVQDKRTPAEERGRLGRLGRMGHMGRTGHTGHLASKKAEEGANTLKHYSNTLRHSVHGEATRSRHRVGLPGMHVERHA